MLVLLLAIGARACSVAAALRTIDAACSTSPECSRCDAALTALCSLRAPQMPHAHNRVMRYCMRSRPAVESLFASLGASAADEASYAALIGARLCDGDLDGAV